MIPTAQEQLLVDLRRIDWARELSDATLSALVDAAECVSFAAGDVVIEFDTDIKHVVFVLMGRMQLSVYDQIGKEVRRESMVRGTAVGLFSLGLGEKSHLHVVATEPTTGIRLTLAAFLELSTRFPDFQMAMFRLAASVAKQLVTVDRSLPKPAVVALIHQGEASRPLTRLLSRRLRDLDESPCVAGDDDRWKPDEDIPFRSLMDGGQAQTRDQILKEWSAHNRLLVDIRVDLSREVIRQVLAYADIALWCIRPDDVRGAVELLRQLIAEVPGWREKIKMVWLLENDNPIAPHCPELNQLAARDFKLSLEPPRTSQQGRLLHQGLERIVHHLRGIQIGLALGGGAARGMAHLGVLQALEDCGIYPDLLAGTSAGAMTGTVYASGMSPTYCTHCFKTDLQPSRFFRQLPGGNYWYLVYKYRWNKFDSMLRKYLDRARMEQLVIPMTTIAVDLVEGEPVIRFAGDATINILESINLPPLSIPIVASGQALVDGGLLNNIPADVLVAQGCNFVIASTVTAKLEKDFNGIRSQRRSPGSSYLTSIQVILRQSMIQGYRMNSVGIQPADFVIAPDVTSFDIAEFTRADEMAVIGESTVRSVSRELKQMLNRLDPRLFPLV